MTSKEKAIELINKMDNVVGGGNYDAKKYALIAVDEILESNPHKIIEKWYVDSGGNKTNDNYFEIVSNQLYWQEVKEEINRL